MAFGPNSFDNAFALDFVERFEEQPSWATIETAIGAINSCGPAYLESPMASEGLAAAEIIAAKLGAPAADFPDVLAGLIGAMIPPPAGLPARARLAVVRIMDNSELAQMWSEDAERGIGQTSLEWLAAMENLLERLAFGGSA